MKCQKYVYIRYRKLHWTDNKDHPKAKLCGGRISSDIDLYTERGEYENSDQRYPCLDIRYWCEKCGCDDTPKGAPSMVEELAVLLQVELDKME